MTRKTKADDLKDKSNWWRPVYPEYGFRIVVPWYTYDDGTHAVVARTVEQALGMFQTLVKMAQAHNRFIDELPEVKNAYAGSFVYPPGEYAQAHTASVVDLEIDLFRSWVNRLFATLVKSGKPLPEGVSECSAAKAEEDGYTFHGSECVCGGEGYIGYDYEREFYSGGRERYDEQHYKRAEAQRIKPPKLPPEYDSTLPHVLHYDPRGPQLYAIGDGNKGLGFHEISKSAVRRFRKRPAWVPRYRAFFQGSEVPVPEPIKYFLDDKHATAKREAEERERQRELDFKKDKEEDVVEAVEFFKKSAP